MVEKPACPVCASADPVYKVSQIYVAGITLAKQRSAADQEALKAVFGKEPLLPAEVQQVSRQFGPPQGGTTVIRPVHPDLVVGLFSIMAAVFLYNTFFVSAVSFWTILVIWLVFLGGYGLARKRVVARHRAVLEKASMEKEGVQEALANWMRLFYCTDDGCVFDPERGDSAPLANFQRYMRMPPVV